jgi:hypothetical protein
LSWHEACIYIFKIETKEDRKMKDREIAKKGLYIGAGAGLVLFAIIGLLPGSFIGGMIGINVAGSLFGMPLEASLISRIIVGISMIFGIFTAGVALVIGTAVAGWLMGHMVSLLANSKAVAKETTVQ